MYSIARQQWRARIETTGLLKKNVSKIASPASNGGRGLKQVVDVQPGLIAHRIARQRWRARIET